MNREREGHFIPALVAVVGVVAFSILVYILIYGAEWLINRLFGSGIGTTI